MSESCAKDYFSTIGFVPEEWNDKPLTDRLQAVVDAHEGYLFYTNQDLLHFPQGEKRSIPAMDAASNWDRVKKTRSGFCFQLLEVLLNGLTILYGEEATVTRHGARVVACDAAAVDETVVAQQPRAHECILVSKGEQTFLVDVGFGPNSLQGPLRYDCEDGSSQQCGDDTYRFSHPAAMPGTRQLDVFLSPERGWVALYRILEAPARGDAIITEFVRDDLYLWPHFSMIRDGMLYVAHTSRAQGRKWLHVMVSDGWGTWKRIHKGQVVEDIKIMQWEHAFELCKKEFGIELDKRLCGLFRGSTTNE